MALQTKTFSYGSFDYKSYSNAYVLDLIFSEESVDPVANTSVVSYKLQLRSGPNNRFNGYLRATVAIDGERVSLKEPIAIGAGYNKTDVLISGQTVVHHDDSGAGKVECVGTMIPIGETATNPYAPPTLTCGGEMSLTDIPRSADVAASSAFIGDAMTIAVARRSPEHTYTLHYQFGKKGGYIANSVGSSTDEPVFLRDPIVLFPVPESFYDEIPDRASGVLTITCATYLGNVELGVREVSVTVTADPDRCGPTLTGNVKTEDTVSYGLTGHTRGLIRGISDIKCWLNATTRGGATIRQRYVNDIPVSESPCVLPAFMGDSLTFRVVDSRGYEATCTPPGATFVPYVNPTFTATASRTDPTGGDVRMVLRGKWFSGSFGKKANTLQLRCRVEDGQWQDVPVSCQGEDVTADFLLSGLDYRRSHRVELQLRDALSECSLELSVPRGVPVFHWGEADFTFEVPVKFKASDGTVFTLDLAGGQLIAMK
jgi:hypothetical protein